LEEKSGQQELEESAFPRSIIVPREDPRRFVRETIDSIFSDRFMAFLAVLLVPIIILEFAVTLSSTAYDFLEICDWTIIILFIVEYVSKLYLAEDRWVHFKSPWHLLDLVIVVIPFVQFLPFFGLKLTGSASLLLRLLRLPRVFAAAGRAASGRERTTTVVAKQEVEQPTIIRKVEASTLFTDTPATVLTWDQVQGDLQNSQQSWIDIYNISPDGFERLGNLLEIAEPYFKTGIIDEIYPHIDYHQDASFIFLHSGELEYPETSENFLKISRSGFVLICTSSKLISVSRHNIDLLNRLSVSNLKKWAKPGSFLVSVLYAVLDSLLTEYRDLLSKIEIDVIHIGNIPRNKLPPDFLERIYQLTKEVSRQDSNLVHFKDLLGIITTKQLPLAGFDKRAEEQFQLLQDSASYLRELSQGLVENLKSVIELYINQESFETNRVLKILAVVTSVAVIPAVVSGMLGMNVLGQPFETHLWEIALSVAITVAFVIYAFTKLGWLRS